MEQGEERRGGERVLEEWRDGEMEGRRDGGTERWRDGRNELKPKTLVLGLQSISHTYG